MNIQKILTFAFYLTIISITSYSCKEVGCTDPEAVTYNMEATEDDGSCRYAGDMLVGDWETTEIVTSSTVNETVTFTSTVTKTDNTKSLITSGRNNPPEYSLGTNPVVVDWTGKRLTRANTTVRGTITDENYFEVTYRYSGSFDNYDVKQEYRRKN